MSVVGGYSYSDAKGDGVNVTFPFSFVGPAPGYMRKSDIHVFLRDANPSSPTYGEWSEVSGELLFPTLNTVTLASAPPSPEDGGSNVRVRRVVSKEAPYADPNSDDIFRKSVLYNSFLLQLYTNHEVLDGFSSSSVVGSGGGLVGPLNANFNRIINLGEARGDGDAISLGQSKRLMTSVVEEEVSDAIKAVSGATSFSALKAACEYHGYNLVSGSFEKGGVISSSKDVLLKETEGEVYLGPIGQVSAGTSPSSPTFTKISLTDTAFTEPQIQQLLLSGRTEIKVSLPGPITTPISIPRNVTLRFLGVTRISMNGNLFTVVTGSRVYGDFIINTGFSPTVCYVDGTYRPTMLLADNRKAGIYGTVRAEAATPAGRGLFLDGNARNGKRGIISWFECDLTLRNVARGCDVEVSNPTGIDGLKSYVNNNYIRLSMWDVPHGYIEADVDTSKAEIAANDVHLDYQTSPVSVQIVRNRGTRNRLHGNIWDTDKAAYPSLLSNAVDIGGGSNVVGGANWPSSTSNVVSISDTLCKYTGYAYGTAKRVTKPLAVFARLGVEQGNNVEGALVGQLGAISSSVSIPAGSVLKSVFARTYGFNPNRVPYFIDGYILLKNTTLSPVNVQVKFGPTAVDGALSSTFQLGAERVKRVDLSLMLSTLRQNATCGDGSWYGSLNYSSLSLHEVHVQVTSAEGVVVDGLVLRRSGEL